MTTTSTEPVRIAEWQGTCPRPGCNYPIFPGATIRKPRGHAWQHDNCDQPRPAKRRRDQAQDTP